MNRAFLSVWVTFMAVLSLAAAAGERAVTPALTAGQIVDRHVTARGGADAWRKIQTMAWTGHIESGPGGIAKTPFLMMFRRPDATRFEIMTQGQRSVRIFDGKRGWKQRPVAVGPPDLKEYSAEEISYARDAAGLDGPLIDYQVKGVGIALEGMDSVEGHAAYRLKVKLPSGQVHDDWIDARSFLELKYDRPTRNAMGVSGVVSVYLRNYQTLNGLTLPFLIETGVGKAQATDKMVIEKIAFNPPLDPTQFVPPTASHQSHKGIVVNTESAGPAPVTH